MDAWKVRTIRLELAKSPGPKSINTQQLYFSGIKAFEEWREDRPVTGDLIELYLQELHEAGKSATRVWETFYALRWWVRRLADLAKCTEVLDPQEVEAILTAREEVEKIRAYQLEPPKIRQPITEEEFSSLVEYCTPDQTAAGARDRAMFSLAHYLGLSVDEITGLDLMELQANAGQDSTLVIRLAGNLVRKIHIDLKSYSALSAWLAVRRDCPGALFCRVLIREKLIYRHLSTGTLRRVLEKCLYQAGIRHLTWGDFHKAVHLSNVDFSKITT